MKHKSQNAALLDYLTNHDYISSFVAFEKLKITSLAKRVCELTALGHEIEKSWVEGENSYGNNTRFIRYRLV